MPTTKPTAARLNWPLMKNNIAREDLNAVVELLQQDDPVLTQSKNVRAFEEEWSRWLGVVIIALAAVFLVILLSLNKARRNLLPIAVSAVAALVAWKFLPGSAYIFVGGLAGTIAGALAGQRPCHAP